MVNWKELKKMSVDGRLKLAEDIIKADDKAHICIQVAVIAHQNKLAMMLLAAMAELNEVDFLDTAEILYKSYSKKQLQNIFVSMLDTEEYAKAKAIHGTECEAEDDS